MPNEQDYLTLIDQEAGGAFKQSLSTALDAQPDTEAKLQALSTRYGVPISALRIDSAAVEKRAKLDAYSYENLVHKAPKTAFFLTDPDKARVAHDDIDNLTGIERALYSLGRFEFNTARAFAASVPRLNEGLWGLGRAGAEQIPFVGAPIAEYFAQMGQASRARAERWMPKADGLLESSWYSGMQSLGMNLAMLPAAAMSGSPSPVLWGMGLSTGGQAYGEARDKGVGVLPAFGFGASQGAIEAGTEMIGMPALFSILKPGSFGKKALEYMVKDQGGEQIATHLQDLNEWATLNPDKSFGDYLAERPTAALQTALSTLFSSGGQAAAMKGIGFAAQRGQIRVQQADAGAELLAGLNELVQANKVLQRSPETFEQFVAHVAEDAPVQTVFIDAQTLMQSGVAEQVAAASPSVAAQLAEAVQTGGQVAIPVEEYAATIAPTEYAQSLLDHLKTEPEGFSRAEAQEYMQNHATELQAEVERTLGEQEGADTFKQSAEVVRSEIKAQLDTAARFTPQVNDAYSSMVGNFYAVTAAKLGTTPEELFKRYPLHIGAESIGGQQFEQPAYTRDQLLELLANADTINIEAADVANGISEDEARFLSDVPAGTRFTHSTRLLERVRRASDRAREELVDAGTPRSVAAKLGPFSGHQVVGEEVAPDDSFNPDGALKIKVYGDEQVREGLTDEPALTFTVMSDGELSVNGPTPGGKTFNEFVARGWAEQSKAGDQVAEGWSNLTNPTGGNLPMSQVLGLLADVHARVRAWKQADKVGLYWSRATGASAGLGDYGAAVFFQPAYHGSPYHFDKFSLDHMGKGEGAQAYGWGLYFAGNKAVAEWYRSNLAESKLRIDYGRYPSLTRGEVDRIAEKWAEYRDTNPEDISAFRKDDPADDADKILNDIIDGFIEVDKGQLYQVEIPEDDAMLLWDKPLREQSEKVRAAVKAMAAEYADLLDDSDLTQSIADNETGDAFYRLATRVTGSDRNASRDLNRHGVSGIKYLDGTSRNQNLAQIEAKVRLAEKRLAMANKAGDAGKIAAWQQNLADAQKELDRIDYNYVIFDDNAVQILETYYQNQQVPRGSFNPASLSITLLKGADLSTFLHESGHFFFEVQADLAAQLQKEAEAFGADTLKPGERQMLEDTNALLKWFGISTLDQWHALDFEEKRSYHEQFARGFEAYLYEGKAPSIELQGLFQRFRAWLVSVYRELKALNVELTDEVRGVFDRMLASNEQITLAEQGRSMMPLFTSPEQAGMTPEEFAAYQALGVDATNAAIEDLQARGLRDMQWLHNARGRVIKQLQRQAKEQRAAVEMDVRREVMSLPIYRTWQFLTGKLTADDKVENPTPPKSSPDTLDETIDPMFVAIAKLGGIDKAEAVSTWGIDPKDKPQSGVFGKPVWRLTGGLSLDGMAERLAQYGYLELDEHGKWDLRALEEKFRAELGGDPAYSTAYDYAGQRPVKPGEQLANPGGLNAARLALDGLDDLGLPAEILAAVKARSMTAKQGLHPDIVAEMFGFSSGDELVRQLAAAETPKAEIDALTDVRMLEQFGDLASPEAIAKAADKAIHNDVRARMIATEANALAKATGQRKTLASAAKEYAGAMIARLKVRGIKPGQYAAAEVRAAKAAEKASKSGDLSTAAAEKRNQLIQNYATRAAYDAQEEVDKGLRYLKKFEGDIKSLEPEYAEQIGNLLERFDLRKGQSKKTVNKRTALAEWITAQREAGLEPDIPPALENEAFRMSYKNMTVEEFRGLVDTVRQIEHLGRLKHKLLTAADQRAYEAVRDEIAASIHANANGREADTRTATTSMGRAVQGLKRFRAAHIKAATWARIMDGDQDGGPVWEYFVRSANERGDQETTMRAEATAKLSEILAPVFALGKMGGNGRYFAGLRRSLNREARLAIALNVGNAGNLQRLLGGEGWTEAAIAPVLRSLTAAEWQAVQAVWDHFESYRPQIAAKERRVYGKEPEWVAPQPFTITSADGATLTLRGGYYPIKYDPAASQRAEEHADAEGAKRQLQGAYTTATTRRSFTKGRVEEVQGRPLLYSLAGLYSGVNDVLHDLAWHEWLIDANRLLRSHTIDAAIREHYGPEVKQQLKTWVQDIAEGDKGAANAGEAALSWLRQGVSVAGLGFNAVSAAMQPLGITQSIVRIGGKWVGRGIARYAAHPVELTRQVNELSEFMANRARTRFRELNELRNQVQDQSAFKEMTGRYAYFLMMRCQQAVDVPTWWGAYEKAIAEGNEEGRAVNLADQAVIDAQGGGQTKDLSAIERGGPAMRLFTVFYSFMNTALNLGVSKAMTASTPAKRAKLAADYLLLYVIPPVLGYVLKNTITPGGDDEDWDWANITKELAAAELDYLMGMMVVVREFSGAAKKAVGVNEYFGGYAGPAGARLVSDVDKLAGQDGFDDSFRKALVNVIGSLFGLPAAQINRTTTGAQAIVEGETSNPAALVFGFKHQR